MNAFLSATRAKERRHDYAQQRQEPETLINPLIGRFPCDARKNST
jgi:hypothetical protein